MPEKSLQRLLEGNRRYAENHPKLDESSRRRIEVASVQNPFATILGCVDSRVPPELLFDQGLGDLFVIRTAGQVLDHAVLGSLEFGVAELQIPLLVVLGHEHCGAVKAALDVLDGPEVAEADIQYLVKELKPAIELGRQRGRDVWAQAVLAQIELLVESLKHSAILSTAVEEGRLRIVGMFYNLETGLVDVTVE
ncbi:MAG: carbonic anhydrase [Caldilineaceae bacterium]|nr:carbonic anhydrase [Caldilineaceae bacterium]